MGRSSNDERPLSKYKREELVSLVRELLNDRKTDVVREAKPSSNDMHPTMKPPRIIRWMLENSSRRGNIILEPFGGSGSTMVACQQLGRRAYMIEIEPRFADVIIRRYETLSGETVARPSR